MMSYNECKNQIVKVEINASENPFAYMREKTDVDILLTNILRHETERGNERKTAARLLHIIVQFLVEKIRIEDRNFKNIVKLLEVCENHKGEEYYDFPPIFAEIIEETEDAPLIEKYITLIDDVGGWWSEPYNTMIKHCREIITSTKESDCLQNLKSKTEPLQAYVTTKDGCHYDFWFNISPDIMKDITDPFLREFYETIEEDVFILGDFDANKENKCFQACVSLPYPFCHYKDDSGTLSEKFLMHLIHKCEINEIGYWRCWERR